MNKETIDIICAAAILMIFPAFLIYNSIRIKHDRKHKDPKDDFYQNKL